MRAIVVSDRGSGFIIGPTAGVFVTVFWLFWLIYILTAFTLILAIAVGILIVLWIRHDWRAYQYRKARRAAETQI